MTGIKVWPRAHVWELTVLREYYYYSTNGRRIKLSFKFLSLYPQINAALRPHPESLFVQWMAANRN